MSNIKKIDSELYGSVYGLPRCGNYDSIWSSIKSDDSILKEAIMLCKDKFGERDSVKGPAICNSILLDYQNVDSEIYKELVNLVCSNVDIARIVLGGSSNRGNSYLLMTLWNQWLVFTEEQKNFIVSEATNQVNGIFLFDIRYQILTNDNWSIEENAKLVYDLFDDESYDEVLEQWEWAIVNDSVNYKGRSLPYLDKCELYNYTYDQLLKFYESKEIVYRIYEEISFCKLMHMLRPQKWERKSGLLKCIGKI